MAVPVLANDLGVSLPTARTFLDGLRRSHILVAKFVMSFSVALTGLGKHIVIAPRDFIRKSGIIWSNRRPKPLANNMFVRFIVLDMLELPVIPQRLVLYHVGEIYLILEGGPQTVACPSKVEGILCVGNIIPGSHIPDIQWKGKFQRNLFH